jgi:hypothetical protein
MSLITRLNISLFLPKQFKKTIERLLGNVIVIQRGDLETGDEWYTFAKLLASGIEYKYGLVLDGGNNVWDTTPNPYSAMKDPEEDDIIPMIFYIPAIVPQRGTSGFFVHAYVEQPFEQENMQFFVHSDQTIARNNASKYVGVLRHSIKLCLIET